MNQSPLLNSGLAMMGGGYNRSTLTKPRPPGLDLSQGGILGNSSFQPRFGDRSGGGLLDEKSMTFGTQTYLSPEEQAVREQMEQEKRVLDMINRVQMF